MVNFFGKSGEVAAEAAKNVAIKLANNPTEEKKLAADLSTAAASSKCKGKAASAPSVTKIDQPRKMFVI